MSDNEDNLSDNIETFDEVGAGASLTRPIRVGELKIGHYVMIENNPCKIIKLTTSKTGRLAYKSNM